MAVEAVEEIFASLGIVPGFEVDDAEVESGFGVAGVFLCGGARGGGRHGLLLGCPTSVSAFDTLLASSVWLGLGCSVFCFILSVRCCRGAPLRMRELRRLSHSKK